MPQYSNQCSKSSNRAIRNGKCGQFNLVCRTCRTRNAKCFLFLVLFLNHHIRLLMSNPVQSNCCNNQIRRIRYCNHLNQISTNSSPLAEKFQVRLGVVSGAMLIPVSTAQEPFVGVTGTGSDGNASEPGT